MFHVLIVDDEIFSVEATLCAINWKKLKVEEVFSAYNMKMAKSIFEQHRIDVMLCDIEMPKGSGIELAAWVKEHFPKTVSLFLTCHSDFQYAKEAVSLGAFEYLLKPMEYEKLENYLARALKEYQRRSDLNAYKDKWFIHHEIVQNKFWSDLILEKSEYSADFLLRDAEKKDIFLSEHARYLPILVTVQNYQELLHSWYGNDLDFAFRNIIYELLDLEECHVAVANTAPNEKMILVSRRSGEGEPCLPEQEFLKLIGLRLEKFSEISQKYFHAQLSVATGRQTAFEGLPQEYRALHGQSGVHHAQESDPSGTDFFQNPKFAGFKPKISDWTEFIFSNRPDLLTAKFEQCFAKDLNAGIQFYEILAQSVFLELLKRNISAYTVFSDERLQKQKGKPTMAAMKILLQNLCMVIFEKTQKILMSDTIVEQVKTYIAQNISSSLSREQLAKQFFLNPDYLTRLFKKETKSSLQTYILKERIKKAKFLLETTDLTISEVHEQSGFANSSYFSKIFKRECGMTPQEYRQQERVRE